MSRLHRESHLVARIGWLRAAVLGANDGIISTASLVLGVASAASSQNEALTAGVAGLVAGAMSMAAGEYVSVSSQFDTERADLARESGELANDRNFRRGGARSNLCWAGRREWACSRSRTAAYGQGCSRFPRSRRAWHPNCAACPVQAALTSAATFSIGAAGPLALVLISPHNRLLPFVSIGSLVP